MVLNNIKLILDNCEKITIPKKYILQLIMSDISLTILSDEIQKTSKNNVTKMHTCKTFFLVIDKSFNDTSLDNSLSTSTTFFDRINDFKDISYVELNYKNKRKEIYYVNNIKLNEKLENIQNNNEQQETLIDDMGNLFISISDTKHIKDYLTTCEKSF